jgi:RNA polymerase sigma-70 factor (ECF subfamily)
MDETTELAFAARDGAVDSVQAFIKATERDVRAFCLVVGRATETDDLVQETFIRAVVGLSTFRGESSARSWLLGIARHVCADDHRSSKRQLAIVDRVRHTPSAHTGTPHDGALALHWLLYELERDQLEAFVLTQVQGLSYAETAQVCECAIGTIRSRVSRARARLVALLEADTAS